MNDAESFSELVQQHYELFYYVPLKTGLLLKPNTWQVMVNFAPQQSNA